MEQIIYRTVNGYCPEAQKQISVSVGFKEIRMVGRMTAEYDPVTFRCEYFMEHGCSLKDNCPIVKSAKF